MSISNQVEFRAQRSNDLKRTKQIFEQVQNFYLLYKSKPKYGPESCEECIEVMSYLRPTENYIDSSSDNRVENFGPMRTRDGLKSDLGATGLSYKSGSVMSEEQSATSESVEEVDLTDYRSKLNSSYLDERPIEFDQDVIYSKGEFCIRMFVNLVPQPAQRRCFC